MHLGAYVLHGTFVEDLGDTLLLDRSDDQAVASAALQHGTPVPFSSACRLARARLGASDSS